MISNHLSFTNLYSDYSFIGLPYTGRMHQIRVHLQWLGHPIVNDPIYNHEAWGPRKGKAGHVEKDIDSVRIQ